MQTVRESKNCGKYENTFTHLLQSVALTIEMLLILTGLLESPVMPPHVAVDTVHYKIFISGKSGVGKTTLAARLAGSNIPSVHFETTGGSLHKISEAQQADRVCSLLLDKDDSLLLGSNSSKPILVPFYQRKDFRSVTNTYHFLSWNRISVNRLNIFRVNNSIKKSNLSNKVLLLFNFSSVVTPTRRGALF